MLPTRDQSNKFWPLPKNYPDLSLTDQREARKRLLTSWWDANKPKELIADPEAFYYAFRFFKEYYLKGWSGNRHIYVDETPDFHNNWIRWFAEHQLMILTSFRGSAKTLVFGLELPTFLIVTRPFTPVQYTSAEDSLTVKQVREVRLQLETNVRIREDFGSLKPARNAGLVWTAEYIELTNGSSFKGLSFESTTRGTTQRSQRAICQIFDDPEDDQKIKNPKLVVDFEDRFFDVYLPAGAPEAHRIWTNTRLDAHAFAVKAADDERLANWYKVQQDIGYVGDDGKLYSYWKSRFPDEAIRAMAGQVASKKGIVSYGDASFLTEFMNDPRRKGRPSFDYDPVAHSARWVDDGRGGKSIRFNDGRTVNLDALRKRSNSIVALDTSLGQTSHSDLTGITVSLLDDSNVLWVVDYVNERMRPKEAAKKVLELADKWKVTAWALQKTLLELTLLDFTLDELTRRQHAGDYYPEIAATKGFSGDNKISHIISLAPRFSENRIVLVRPDDSDVAALGAFIELEDQIKYFTPRGAFKFDDVLETLVIAQDAFLMVGQGVYVEAKKTTEADRIKQAIKDGVNVYPGTQNLTNEMIIERWTQPTRDSLDVDDMPLALMGEAFEGELAGSVFGGELW